MIDALVSRRSGEDTSIDEVRDRFNSRSRDDSFSVIAANAALGPEDSEVFAVLAAAEFAPFRHQQIAGLHGAAARNRITLGLLTELFVPVAGHRGPRVLGRDAALCRSELVTVDAVGPWSDHVAAVHSSVMGALAGDESLDPELPLNCRLEVGDELGGDRLVVVTGLDRQRRTQAAVRHTFGTRFISVDAPNDDAGWAALVREATITGAGMIVHVDDALTTGGRRCLERATHLSWAVASKAELPLDQLPARPWVAVEAAATPLSDEEWADAFGDTTPRTHPLKPEQLEPVQRALDAHGGDLDAAVRRLVSGLDGLATRVRPSRAWDDLVLSPSRMAGLQAIVDRYRFAGRVFDEWGFDGGGAHGTVALFSGPSGTGKTLAAEVIAGSLGLDLFKLDLSSVVSKYVGETEKNLERIFDAARAGILVLFFDEADALFGKRSEVKAARDRYANVEVSYLLQRLEAYEGLVVMATNFEKNVDDAFLRRIHTRVEFALPGVDERIDIWRRNLPDTAPIGDVDVAWLAAQFEIAGGLIRNAAVHAAFIAAATDEQISTQHAVIGVSIELRKLGRLITADGFGEYYDTVIEFGAS